MDPVILLTVDSLRQDVCNGEYLPESFPILRDDFAHFPNCYSHGVATPFAFPGIISSSLPCGDGYLPDSAIAIGEVFTDRYSSAFTNNSHLTERRGYNRGFDSFGSMRPPDDLGLVYRLKDIHLLHQIGPVKRIYDAVMNFYRDKSSNPGTATLPVPYETADEVNEYIIRQLTTRPDPFIWGHYMDPHWPFHPETAIDTNWEKPIEDLASLGDRFIKGEASVLAQSELDELYELYLGNVRYFDRELARLLSWLKQKEWYENALIILVSDHGELFGENGYCFHPWDAEPIDELINTSLFVKYPNGEHEGTVFDHIVGHWDILKTITHWSEATTEQFPEYTYRLSAEGTRHILSASNTIIRLTESDGKYLRYRSGQTEVIGNISKSGRELADSVEFIRL